MHNITWRALPVEFGKWNGVWKRCWRLSRAGVFEGFFQLLAEQSSSSIARSCAPMFRPQGQKGQKNQALGRSRGGFSTKIHLKTDLDGNPLDFHLTGGEASDTRQFETSLDLGPDITPRMAIGV